MLIGLEYLHYKGIVHADIKGANILLNNKMEAKICDLGSCKNINNQDSNKTTDYLKSIYQSGHTIRGTVHWMAPEMIQQSG